MPFDSLFIGVTGLDSYQSQIDVISNNIANVGTTGYKDQNVNFSDLFYQTQQYATAPNANTGGTDPSQIGLGVKIGSISTNFSQGGLETTGVNTNLALNGNGYFVLGNIQGGGTPQYTRAGAFNLNANGTLYDPSSGLAVLGYQANSKTGTITQTGVPSSIQIPLGLKSQATGTGYGTKLGPTGDQVFDVSFGGNLDQSQYVSAVSAGTVTLTTISTTVYDSLGNGHLVNIVFTPATAAPAAGSGIAAGVNLATAGTGGTPLLVGNSAGTMVTAATEWSYTIEPTDGSVFTNGTANSINPPTGYVFFDQNGQFINTMSAANGGNPATVVGAATHQAGGQPSTGVGDQLQVTSWSVASGANNATTPGTPAATGPIALDFSNMTSLSGNPAPTTLAQNGFGQGTLSNISVGLDGVVTGSFTNGQTQTLAQVAVATFQNQSGLLRQGNNYYVATPNSGLAQYGTANTGQYGQIVSGSLEQSNVSLADEFAKMIFAQRAFQANTSSIQTANQDLQTVLQLIPA
jgi:flagellar hook protein FlgE